MSAGPAQDTAIGLTAGRGEAMSDGKQAPQAAHGGGHGNSVAAWTAVGIMMVGFLVASIAVAVAQLWLGIVGAVVVVLGAVVGKVLSAMGFGSHSAAAPHA
ncbi:MAG: HGxxPAAW family protein [Kineosporiaceae bacterium]